MLGHRGGGSDAWENKSISTPGIRAYDSHGVAERICPYCAVALSLESICSGVRT